MIKKHQIKDFIREAADVAKAVETQIQDIVVTDDTVILGNDGLFDSVAFSAFAVALEERLEEEMGEEFILNAEQIFKLNPGSAVITVANLAESIYELLVSEHKT